MRWSVEQAVLLLVSACTFDSSGPVPGVDAVADATGDTDGFESGANSSGASGGATQGAECMPSGLGCSCSMGRECGSGQRCDEVCVEIACGDAFVDTNEECDDGNSSDGDGCESDCTATVGAAGVFAGAEHTCGLLHSGRLRCWGHGGSGRTGLGRIENVGDDELASVALDVDTDERPVDLALGEAFSCALLEGGAVQCWGSGLRGQLGLGRTINVGDDELPSTVGVVELGDDAIAIAAGSEHACAIVAQSRGVRCWGSSDDGRLGYAMRVSGDIGDDERPSAAPLVGTEAIAQQIVAGRAHTCILTDFGAVRCWGSGLRGVLGYGNTESIGDDENPSDAGNVEIGGTVTRLFAGRDHTCAITDAGGFVCWGWGAAGRLGTGHVQDIGDDETPAVGGVVDLGGLRVVDAALGDAHTCVLLTSGAVRCFGTGADGRLGYGDSADRGLGEVPASLPAVRVGAPVVQIAAGRYHTCARLDTHALRCWGGASVGQLGYGDTASVGDDEVPEQAGDIPFF